MLGEAPRMEARGGFWYKRTVHPCSPVQETRQDNIQVLDRNSDVFITFMLDKINLTLDWALQQLSEKDAYLPAEVQKLLDAMEYDVPYTGKQLIEKLSLKSRDNFRKLYLLPALEQGLIVMSIPDKPTSRNQTY